MATPKFTFQQVLTRSFEIIGAGLDAIRVKIINPEDIADEFLASVPKIYNVPAAVAGTEYSQALSAGTRKIMFKTKSTGAKIKFSFVAGESGTKFISVGKNTSHEVDDLNLTSITLYFQTNKNNQTLQIMEWT